MDLPQNPLDLEAEYAVARTDRTHVFTANYVYELPFFSNSKGLQHGVLGGWQLSGHHADLVGPADLPRGERHHQRPAAAASA